jgi:hypothetical protein
MNGHWLPGRRCGALRRRELEMGQLVQGTKLRVIGYGPSDKYSKQMVMVRCEWIVDEKTGKVCGTERLIRATAMTHKPYADKNGKWRLPQVSCGCRSKQVCREYWVNRAKKTARVVQQAIYWGRVGDGKSDEDLAREFKMPKHVVTTILRLFGQRMKAQGRLR